MIALYTEDQLTAAFQIYGRIHASYEMDAVDYETFRGIFEHQFMAMSQADEIFNGEGTTH